MSNIPPYDRSDYRTPVTGNAPEVTHGFNPSSPQPASPQPASPQPLQSHGDIGGGLDFISNTRDEEDFREARRHSALVRVLRVALPAIAVVVIAGFIAAMVLQTSGGPDVSVENLGISDGKLVMENPELNGTDDEKRPYTLSADKAIQDVNKPTQVTLETISATLPMDDGIFARVKAGNGFYDAEMKTLQLGGNINVDTDNGMTITMTDADVDIDKGLMSTDKPVVLTSEQARIQADRLRVENSGEKIIFESRVRLRIEPGAFDRGAFTNPQAVSGQDPIAETISEQAADAAQE